MIKMRKGGMGMKQIDLKGIKKEELKYLGQEQTEPEARKKILQLKIKEKEFELKKEKNKLKIIDKKIKNLKKKIARAKSCIGYGKIFFARNSMHNQKLCSKKCSEIFNLKKLHEWYKDPKNKDEIGKKNSLAGKIGYKAIEKWQKENPKKYAEQRSNNGKKSIAIRKARGTFYEEQVKAGGIGSHEDKVRAGKINAKKNLQMLRDNSKKYGHLGGKIYNFDGEKFRSKLEIKVYNFFKKIGINPEVNFEVGGKEFDFKFKNIVIEVHPVHPHYDKRTSKEYFEDRLKVLQKNNYSDYRFFVFTNFQRLKKFFLLGGIDNGSKYGVY